MVLESLSTMTCARYAQIGTGIFDEFGEPFPASLTKSSRDPAAHREQTIDVNLVRTKPHKTAGRGQLSEPSGSAVALYGKPFQIYHLGTNIRNLGTTGFTCQTRRAKGRTLRLLFLTSAVISCKFVRTRAQPRDNSHRAVHRTQHVSPHHVSCSQDLGIPAIPHSNRWQLKMMSREKEYVIRGGPDDLCVRTHPHADPLLEQRRYS